MCKNDGMFSALKKCFAALLIFVFLLLTSPLTYAQDTSAPEDPATEETTTQAPATQPAAATDPSVGQPVSQKNYKAPQNANYTFQNLFHAGFCELIGMSPLIAAGDIGKCVGTATDGKVMAYDRLPGGGAMGTLASLTGNMYIPPTSTTYYLANLGRDIGVVDSVYAQSVTGSGASLITPVEALWRVSRNFSYIIFTLIFLTVGFMIMLRKKLNPQTVITIQTALPGLVVGLFLVTFSYFLTALIIDISFLGIPLVANLFAQSAMPSIFSPNSSAQDYQNLASDSNILQLFGTTSGDSFTKMGDFRDVVGGLLDSVPGGRVLTTATAAVIGALVFMGPWGLAAGALGFVAPEIIALLVPFILTLALFVQFFRLFLKLVSAYIMILVMAVISPLLITFGSLPGKGGTITFWWKTVLANTIMFPAVFAVFLFCGIILDSGTNFSAPPPLFGGLDTRIIKFIVAYGILLGSPAIPDLVKNLLGVKDVPGISQSAIAGAVGGYALGKTGFMSSTKRTRENAEAYRQNRLRTLGGDNNTRQATWGERLFGAGRGGK